jgi:hypothetical protein
MTPDSRPVLECGFIPHFDLESWPSIESAFAGARACHTRQFWKPALEPAFRAARIKVGWRDGSLLVHAVLDDDDIFNSVIEFNEPAYMKGDVFEMFLRPVDQDPYFEIHVSPVNQKFQVRFPSAAAFQGRPQGSLPPEWMIRNRVIESRVLVEPEQKRWRVLAKVPFDMIAEKSTPTVGSKWLFSFSRYDYTRGAEDPVYSSTSPHMKLSYHIQADWGTLVFK